jgi:hypothetical protein
VQKVGYGSLRPEILKDKTIEQSVAITLEQAYNGTCIKVPWSRKVMETPSTDEVMTRKETFKLDIIPGTKSGTRLLFKEMGDQAPNRIPADLVFIIEIEPHPVFERHEQHHLIYKQILSLKEALTGTVVHITTLDERELHIPIYEVVQLRQRFACFLYALFLYDLKFQYGGANFRLRCSALMRNFTILPALDVKQRNY